MIFLSLVGLLFIRIPSVQTHLVNRFTVQINQNFETDIKVEGVSVGFDGSVNLNSFFIADHHSDTLFYAKKFKTDLYSLRQWVNGNLFFSTTQFENVFLKIIEYEGEENNSLFEFYNKFLVHGETENYTPVFIRIDDLNIIEGNLLIIDKKNNQKLLHSEELNLRAKDFYIINEGLDVSIKNLRFNSKEYGNINLFDTNLNYSPCKIDVNSFRLSSGKSEIAGMMNIFLPKGGFFDFKDKAQINLEIKSFLRREQLKYFIDLPENFQPIDLKINGSGTLNNFNFSTIEIEQEVIKLSAKLFIKEALSLTPMKARLEIDDFKIINSKLTEIVPINYTHRIPIPILAYKPFEGKGTFLLENNQIKTEIELTSSNASLINQSVFFIEQDQNQFKLSAFEGSLDVSKLDLSPWYSDLGNVSLKFLFSGDRVERNYFNFDYDLDIYQIEFYKKSFKNLTLKGDLKKGKLNANLSIEDEFVKGEAVMAHSWEESPKKYQIDINLDALNLHFFNPELGGGKAKYSGDFNLFLIGNTLDELQGNLLFKNLKFENKIKTNTFNDFIIETSLTDQKRIIRAINSEILDLNVEGKFQLSNINNLFINSIAEAFPFIQKKKFKTSQDLIYEIGVQTSHLNAVFPKLLIDKKAVFRGILSTEDNISKMTLNIPMINFDEIYTENIEIQLNNQNPLFNTFMSVAKIETDSYQISDFNTLGVKKGDVLNFRTEFRGRANKEDVYELNYSLIIDEFESKILLQTSTIKFNNSLWRLNPKSDQEHLISYCLESKNIDLKFLEAESADEKIEMRGNYQSLDNFKLDVNMDNFSLENLGLSRDDFDFRGGMDLRLNIKRSRSDNMLDFSGNIDNFILNDLAMGSLRFFTSGNPQFNSYKVNLFLTNLGNRTLSAQGNILGFNKTPRLDLDFNFDDFDLSFLTAVGAGDIDNIRGKVTGNLNLWGPIDSPKHNGELILYNGGLGVPYINTDYDIEDGTRVSLVDQSFIFNKTSFRDTRFDTKGQLVGQISHLNFSDWTFDLNISSDRILMINIPEDEDEVFFGDGFLGGQVHLHGPSKNLTIDVAGSTEEGTSLKIPWAKDYGLADTSFINFVDKKKIRKTEEQKKNDDNSFSGLQMNFELDIDNNSEIKVVIDKESGSFLSGHGAGNILMEIDTNGKFNMWGDFITYDGIYNFKNLSVIDKKFNLKEGGTIVWEGDPLGAQMDLEAVYEVPGGANPAILLDNPNFNRKIPTEVIIRLQGNLLKPDDPIFEIDFPNTSAVVNSEINYRLADPQISQLQAISLLSQGIFINEVSISVQGITNNLYEKASDLFSNLMGDDQGKLKVGFNYLQGDKSSAVDINSEDRLGLTLSTQITDKILLNGKIGVPVGGIEETLIVGDLQIDFILNEEGTLKAKVFNKENEFRYIGDELGYTQGVGLSYQVDFETFRQLITKILKGVDSAQVFQNEMSPSAPSDLGINFIDKN